MFHRTVLVVAMVAAGCATRKPAPVNLARNDVAGSRAGEEKGKGFVACHMESDTGSHLLQRVCESFDQNGISTPSDGSPMSVQEEFLRIQQAQSVQQISGH